MSRRGFGVAAGLDEQVAVALAVACEQAGYDSLWSNDHPGAKGLDTLTHFMEGARKPDLGVAVIAVDRQQPDEIAADIERHGLPTNRLWIGLGAGFSEKPLTAMREALPRYRDALPECKLVLAAMGPKMCMFGGAEWDGVFFNWMTPEFAATARENVIRGSDEAGREPPPIFGYVRTAVGEDAASRLAKEEGFYRDLHDGYRNHFKRLGEPEGTVGVAAADAAAAQERLSAYTALDTAVVRGLASANIEAMTAVASAAAPR